MPYRIQVTGWIVRNGMSSSGQAVYGPYETLLDVLLGRERLMKGEYRPQHFRPPPDLIGHDMRFEIINTETGKEVYQTWAKDQRQVVIKEIDPQPMDELFRILALSKRCFGRGPFRIEGMCKFINEGWTVTSTFLEEKERAYEAMNERGWLQKRYMHQGRVMKGVTGMVQEPGVVDLIFEMKITDRATGDLIGYPTKHQRSKMGDSPGLPWPPPKMLPPVIGGRHSPYDTDSPRLLAERILGRKESSK